MEVHVVRDALLCILDCAAQVAATNAELDRNEALHALVVNPGRSGVEGDGGQFTQGDVGISAAGGCDTPP